METAELRAIHDALLADKPSGVDHDPESCHYCTTPVVADDPSGGGGMSDTKTYSQSDLDAAVLEALKPLQTELDSLRAGQEQEEVERRIAEVKAALEETVAGLQADLDTANLLAEQAKKSHDDLVAFLAAEQAAQDEAVEIARRRDDRLALVRQVASFSDDYIEKAADRWAALDEDAFNALVDDWKAISTKDPTETPVVAAAPTTTAMTAARETTVPEKAVMRELMDLGLQGVALTDLR